MKTLKELIRMTPVEKVTGNADIEIKDVTADSRMVVEGGLFICLS